MFVSHKKKTIYAFHCEECIVANFLMHCVKNEPGWSVTFVSSEKEMNECKNEPK